MDGLRKTASELGLAFNPGLNIFNTRLAQELGLWAAGQGKGESFHMAVFNAYFVESRNIASKQVLLDIVECVGLPTDDADNVITRRTFRDAVDQDWTLSRKLNITAVPTMIYNGNRLVGAHPYEKMVDLVKNGRGHIKK